MMSKLHKTKERLNAMQYPGAGEGRSLISIKEFLTDYAQVAKDKGKTRLPWGSGKEELQFPSMSAPLSFSLIQSAVEQSAVKAKMVNAVGIAFKLSRYCHFVINQMELLDWSL